MSGSSSKPTFEQKYGSGSPGMGSASLHQIQARKFHFDGSGGFHFDGSGGRVTSTADDTTTA